MGADVPILLTAAREALMRWQLWRKWRSDHGDVRRTFHAEGAASANVLGQEQPGPFEEQHGGRCAGERSRPGQQDQIREGLLLRATRASGWF